MIGSPPIVKTLKPLKRKEKEKVYKPSDHWTVEDDLLFLKYCPLKRDRCYHAMSRDASCRPHELLKLRIKDVVFKMARNKQYAEVLLMVKPEVDIYRLSILYHMSKTSWTAIRLELMQIHH